MPLYPRFRLNPSVFLRTMGALLLTLMALPAMAQRPLLSKHVPEMVTNGGATRVQALARTETLDLVISLPLRNQSELDGLLADIYNRRAPTSTTT